MKTIQVSKISKARQTALVLLFVLAKLAIVAAHVNVQETKHVRVVVLMPQLERSEDGFSVVADYLGRGLFQRLTLLAPATAAAAGPAAAELRAARS